MSHTWQERANYMLEERDKLVARCERLRNALVVFGQHDEGCRGEEMETYDCRGRGSLASHEEEER